MTHYLSTAPAHTEFVARDTLADLGISCLVPRKVEMVRLPKRRRPEPVIEPLLQGYLFATMNATQWHLAAAEGIMRTVKVISPKEWDKHVLPFAARVEADYQYRMAQIEAGERIAEYHPGQALQILGGALIGQFATFRSIVDGMVPMLKVEYECVMGRITGLVDPIYARAAG